LLKSAEAMDFERLIQRFTTTRAKSEKLAEPLSEEDCLLQAMPDVSPTKWHLAHTSWFYEQFLLLPYSKKFRPFRPDYSFLFNSYYEGVGTRVERPKRGLLSRPSLNEVQLYRKFVTAAVQEFLSESPPPETLPIVELGIHHEEQHQELILTDIKFNLFCNPQRPAYSKVRSHPIASKQPPTWISFAEGIHHIGCDSKDFAFDNERPRHRVFLENFEIYNRGVTNEEYLEFIEARGYQRPDLWLSDGWAAVQKNNWTAPLYWEPTGSAKNARQSFSVFTLQGMQPLPAEEPVTHLSHYEADAYARFRGKRLPSEMEWETAVANAGTDLEDRGISWEWTSSAYLPYPGFRPFENGLGEYNGKFMSNQMVLRGGSIATPHDSLRTTYRNFFPPESRWQFTGVRLAQ
jgi:ergothioneine biosynthesis protein EgtB